jgi:hypothetical protein
MNNDKRVKVINVTSRNIIVDSAVFLHCNIYKYIWASPDGKAHNKTDHAFDWQKTAFYVV